MFNVSKSVQEKIKMGCLQRQFGKDFHKLELFLFTIACQEHNMVDKSLVLQWKVLSVKWLKSPIAVKKYIRREAFDNGVVV